MTQTSQTTSSGTVGQATATLPQAIAAATQVARPDGYTLITLGFKSALNYNFVVSNPISSAQIFAFLPEMLRIPFENSYENITVQQLVPLQSKAVSYLATVAEVYFPTSEISALSKLISNTSSNLYTDVEGPAKYLAYLIDASIPLTGLLGSDTSNPNMSSRNSSSSTGSSDDNFNSGALGTSIKNINGSGSSLTSSKSKIAGLVVGVVAGGCTYIAAMILLIRFFVVRRQQAKNAIKFPDDSSDSTSESGSDAHYHKQEKVTFDDQESITPSMRINNWMNESHYYDVAGPDIRVAQIGKKATSIPKISRPIASQNSLGWNEI